jgi:hypothetical protein
MFNESEFNSLEFNNNPEDLEIFLNETVLVYSDTTQTILSQIHAFTDIVECSSNTENCRLNINYNSTDTTLINISDTTSSKIGLIVNINKMWPNGYNYLPSSFFPPGEGFTFPPIQIFGISDTVNSELELNTTRFLDIVVNKRFVFKSVPPNIKDERLDEMFKLMSLYSSLSNVDSVLNSVKRSSDKKMEDLGIYKNQLDNNGNIVDPVFYNNDDLYVKNIITVIENGEEIETTVIDKTKNIPVGTRGYVGVGAEGVFKNKDGWFVVYLGKTVR